MVSAMVGWEFVIKLYLRSSHSMYNRINGFDEYGIKSISVQGFTGCGYGEAYLFLNVKR